MPKTYINKRGYRCFADSGRLVHRWVAKKKYGSIPKGNVIHHKDGNKLNNHPNNLQLMTKKEHAYHHFTNSKNLNIKILIYIMIAIVVFAINMIFVKLIIVIVLVIIIIYIIKRLSNKDQKK